MDTEGVALTIGGVVESGVKYLSNGTAICEIDKIRLTRSTIDLEEEQ